MPGMGDVRSLAANEVVILKTAANAVMVYFIIKCFIQYLFLIIIKVSRKRRVCLKQVLPAYPQ